MRNKLHLDKNISTFSLTMTAITTMMGSGWLLATQKIANIAGPAGILSWVIGMVVVIIIASFCIEIGSSHPSAGGMGYYSQLTHGRFCGFLTQWINWLSVVAIPIIEAEAIVRYLSGASPEFHVLDNIKLHQLTIYGYTASILIMFLFMLINYWGMKLFFKFNNFFTLVKIVIPILTIIILFYSGFNYANFGHSMAEFNPYGWGQVGYSIISCGVIMSFNGFQTPLSFSEEIKNPKKQLPIAIISAIIFTCLLYIALQILFIGKVSSSYLVNGWHGVNYRSPYVDLMLLANFQLMAWVVMSTSVIAPAACGATYISSGSRMTYNLSRSGFLPGFMNVIHPKYHIPRGSIIVNIIASCAFIIIFSGWNKAIAIVSVLHVFSYLSIPVVVVAYRRSRISSKSDAFKLPFGSFFAVLLLFILSLLLFESKTGVIISMGLLLIPGICFYVYYEYKQYKLVNMLDLLSRGLWIIFYILAIILINYCDNCKSQIIGVKSSILLLFILSVGTHVIGVKSAIKGDKQR